MAATRTTSSRRPSKGRASACTGPPASLERISRRPKGCWASGVSGLGLIKGEVRRLPSGLKVPHMGWNGVITRRADPVISDLREGAFVYFVHSYVVDPRDPAGVIATATYGREFPAIIRQGNVLGLQFHPEKSAATGLGLLREIVGWIAATAPSVRVGTRV